MRLAALALLLAGCELAVPTPALHEPDAALVDAGPPTVTIVPRGNGTGVVKLDPGDHECPSPGPACSFEVTPGVELHLSATPDAGSVFGLWTGVSTCTASECTFTPTGSVTVTGSIRLPFDVGFVTSTERTPGSLGGRAGADAECVARARAGGWDGNFEAVLSDGTPLAGLPGSLVRTDGLVLTPAPFEQFAMVLPFGLDELGQPVPEGARVVTDLVADLRPLDGDHCSGYRLEAGTVGYGLPSATASLWVNAGRMGCGEKARLYCVQTDALGKPPDLPPPAPSELRAFFYFLDSSKNGFVPGGNGRSDADVVCDAYGDRTLGDSTWIALLATPTEAPTRRLPDGKVWKRVDGAPFGSSAELKAGKIAAPLNADPFGSGTILFGGSTGDSAFAWIGAPSLKDPGTDATTCHNWSVSTNQFRGRAAAVSAGLTHFDADEDCNRAHGLWCLELPP